MALFLIPGLYSWSLLDVVARLPEFKESESRDCTFTPADFILHVTAAAFLYFCF